LTDVDHGFVGARGCAVRGFESFVSGVRGVFDGGRLCEKSGMSRVDFFFIGSLSSQVSFYATS